MAAAAAAGAAAGAGVEGWLLQTFACLPPVQLVLQQLKQVQSCSFCSHMVPNTEQPSVYWLAEWKLCMRTSSAVPLCGRSSEQGMETGGGIGRLSRLRAEAGSFALTEISIIGNEWARANEELCFTMAEYPSAEELVGVVCAFLPR
eukprot:scaffold134634_cov18-Tisochrysis_lutea.AAC.2